MRRLAQVGDFCPNSSCSNHDQCAGEGSPGIIIKHGKTRSGRQRFRCKACGSSFTSSKGTLFYRKRNSEKTIIDALSQIAEGSRSSSVSRTIGAEQTVRELLGENTAYAERNHLTMRHFNGRLVRKSLAFSKKVRMLAVSTAWEDLYYNFVRVHKSLRKPSRKAGKTQWIQQTPAMAANLARQPYTVRSLLFAVVPKQHLIG